MRKRAILVTASVIAVGAILLAATTCGGPQTAIRSGGFQTADSLPTTGSPQSVEGALAELDALGCPAGVDAALWAELKGALEEALKENGSAGVPPVIEADGGRDARPTKSISTPPTGEANRVNDLGITDNGDGTYTLAWHYRNLGDYDQNGRVAIADITPLAQHFGETYDPETEPHCIQAVIDGSGNGKVGIEDVTPIAQCFNVDCAGYRIEGADGEAGPFSLVQEVAVEEASGGGRLQFAAELGALLWGYYRVVPLDGLDIRGIPGNVVSVVPIIHSVSPLGGAEGADVTFSADVDGLLPLAFAWDFDGGAQPDTTNVASPTVILEATGNYPARLTVANAFGSDSLDFTLAVELAPSITCVDPTWGNPNEAVTFSVTAEGTPPLAYQWDFGGGAIPNAPLAGSTEVILGMAGTYEASVSVSNAYGTDTYTFTLRVGIPHVVSVNPTEALSRANVNFSALVEGTQPIAYAWDFGDAGNPTITNEPSPWVLLLRGDDYQAELVVSNEYGEDVYDFCITVMPHWIIGSLSVTTEETRYPSLALVNGKPAVAYYDTKDRNLCFVGLYDEANMLWGIPVLVDGQEGVGLYPSLAIVQGNPAISYADSYNNRLKYVRGADSNGQSWSPPILVNDADVLFSSSSLHVVDGRPAISYFGGDHNLRYIRATDIYGTSWGEPVTVDGADVAGPYCCLRVIDGRPAISYWCPFEGGLKYVFATDSTGDSWDSPIIVDGAEGVGRYTSLEVVDGNPAISYDGYGQGLKYVRASDPQGQTWGVPLIVDGAMGAGMYTSLRIVDGVPAIAYYDDYPHYDLKYVMALDAAGSAWGSPETVDSTGDVGQHASMCVFKGRPIITYCRTSGDDLRDAWFY